MSQLSLSKLPPPAPPELHEAPSSIAFFDQRRSFEKLWPDLRRLLDELIDRGKFSHGMMVERLEAAICDFTGARHAIGVNSGTDALILLLRAAGIGPGDEVIVPCFTFMASASSIAHAGATPVFVDIDPETYTLDVEQIRAAITARTRAIMPVHLFTQLADMAPLLEIAATAGVMVIEDSAEAIGMRHGQVHAGLLGTGGILSFFPTKTLGALGDAGMILTNRAEIAEKTHVMRHHGRQGQTVDHMPGISHEAIVCGTNSKMDDIQAAVLLAKLPSLEQDIARRAELARLYDQRLSGLWPRVRVPQIAQRAVVTRSVYYTYVIETERKPDLVAFLKAHGVETEEYYPRPLHLQPCFLRLGYKSGDFPVAEAACRRTLALPLYPDLREEEVDRVCALLETFHHHGGV